MAILVVSHQLNLVARFASSMVLLRRGRVAASGLPAPGMRPDKQSDVYDWPVDVERDASGSLVLTPQRSTVRKVPPIYPLPPSRECD
jgi:ABC-type hemin transport system ATPase subunit